MFELIITAFSSVDILSAVAQHFEAASSFLSSYLSGTNNLRIVSIILILLAVVLLLFLVIVLYVRALVSFLKNDTETSDMDRSFFAHADDSEKSREREQEIEKELEKELEKARVEKIYNEQKELSRRQREAMEKEAAEQAEEKRREEKKFNHTKEVALDWQKGRLREIDTSNIALHSLSLQYQQNQKSINELLGLVLDMLARGVDDLKIAQAIMFRNQGKNSEDDVLQTVEAIKEFVELCLNSKFDFMYSSKDTHAALRNISNGDTSAALGMLQSLMDENVQKSLIMKKGDARDQLLRDTSQLAVLFASLSSLSDMHLATGGFELAIELWPQNVVAWSRLADMYNYTESHKQATWAYENLLGLADENLHIRQVANAQKMLSHYYYEQGDNLKAAKFYNNSKQYYDSIGINRRLDKQEMDIVEFIEKRRHEDIDSTISKLLSRQNTHS